MVKITDGTRTTVVTQGVFTEQYEPYGWKICDISNENTQVEELPEEVKIFAEQPKESPQGMPEMPEVEPEEEEETEFIEEVEEVEIPISEMTVAELKAFAAKHDIDISAARNKQDIKDIIKAEMEA